MVAAGIAIGGPVVSPDPAPKKVACVGGSVTWGYWLDYPIKRKTYPDHLATLLGPGYQVRNYGFGGATAGRYPNEDGRAYLLSGEQAGTVKWQPDSIVGGLGVNDCIPTWHDPEKFEQGYRDLVGTWRANGRNPSIWLWNRLTPDYRGLLGVPAFPGNIFGPSSTFTTNDDGMAANRPAVQARLDLLGPSLGIGLIDAYSQLSAVPQWAGEGLHLVEPGLKRLAELIYCQAWSEQSTSALPCLTEAAPNPGAGSPSDENGFKFPWIELHNPFPYGICLDGLALDSGAGTDPFTFTSSTVLWPGERRIVFLSGNNRKSPIKNLHTNFTVDNAEGQVRLLSRNGGLIDSIGWRNWTASGSLGRPDTVTTAAVGPDSFHLRLLTSNPPQDWQQPEFSASGWNGGTGGTGSELPAKAETQFAKRWSANQAPTNSVWNLTGSWSSQGDGTYKTAASGAGMTVPSWISSNDASWTAEAKVKLNGFQTGSAGGYVIRCGTRHVGGAYTTLYIQSNQVVFGSPYEHGAILSTQDNTDDFHIFRIAYHAPTRHFFVWRDGVEISSRTDGRMRDSSRFNWLAMGAAHSGAAIDAVVDYSSYDITGAYAPEAVNEYLVTDNHETEPLTTDSTGPINPDTSCLIRMPFNGSAHAVAGMKLKMEFDDGFRAWLNGVEIASCNAPASGSTAPLARDNSWGINATTLDVSEYSNLIQPTGNVLAVQIFNASENDGRCFGRACLDLIGPMSQTARYFSPPNAGAASGTGSPLPAQGWVYPEEPPTSGGGAALLLELDSDGDGRSNLLEYSQGTNVNLADSSPTIQEDEGIVKFLWRTNMEVGWRLMESTDQQEWHPAIISGPPQVSSSGISGMQQVSQPVANMGRSYRLAAVEQPSLNNWRQRYFTPGEISAGVITGDNADPDGDRLPNFLEFAIASNPRVVSSRLMHGLPNSRHLAFPDPGSDRGTSWRLQSSGNLSLWNTVQEPDMKCMIDPVSGRYELGVSDPNLPLARGFMRMDFTQSGL